MPCHTLLHFEVNTILKGTASAGSQFKGETTSDGLTLAAEHGPEAEAAGTQLPFNAGSSQEGYEPPHSGDEDVEGQQSDAAQPPTSQQTQEHHQSLTGNSLCSMLHVVRCLCCRFLCALLKEDQE